MIETAPRSTIRTIVASFVFTDLVGFSKGTATDQYAAKARLSSVLRTSLAALRESDYWIKDTGDGALIAFVSNPEHALYMALALAQAYPASAVATASDSLRTGLHLGTVKESIDVEARRNFIGDGINAAKRIMDFAQPGQMAASRSFFEAIANLDAAYAALFEHVGAPDDKHGRAHDLYTLAPSESVLAKLRTDLAIERADEAGEAKEASASAAVKAPSTAAAPKGRRALVAAGVGILAIAAVFVVMRMREPPLPAATTPVATPPPIATGNTGNASPHRGESETPAEPAASNDAVARPQAIEAPAQRPMESVNEPSSKPESTARASPPVHAKNTDVRPKASPSTGQAAETHAAGASPSPRCSRILEKAALGEPLTPDEKKELANSCR